jgi:hypothetical protein
MAYEFEYRGASLALELHQVIWKCFWGAFTASEVLVNQFCVIEGNKHLESVMIYEVNHIESVKKPSPIFQPKAEEMGHVSRKKVQIFGRTAVNARGIRLCRGYSYSQCSSAKIVDLKMLIWKC